MTKKKDPSDRAKKKDNSPAVKTAICPFRKGIETPINGMTKLIVSPPEEQATATTPVNFGAFRDKVKDLNLPVPPLPCSGSKYFDYYSWAKEVSKQPGARTALVILNDLANCKMQFD